ncbi:pyridoxamine 5'-phosphate oxidase family protein [Arboricoccus pini]|uniref:pyridoxamine 5'-phosphate oxidase family protein n=1 Tax=Arboricoccus pini TaxID=1963835 RepID=UPI001A9C31E3|nr:pyridoxamine 5'-phosphate oxidase family protein [Arboricoccus pini]
MSVITDAAQLRALYGQPGSRALKKQLSGFERHSRHFVGLSPFCLLATSDAEGRVDVTPRGGPPGFVQILDDQLLLLPDWPGNNRLDSLLNILANPEAGLLFLIPGVDEGLRVNGRAEIRTDPDLLERYGDRGRLPRTVLHISVREVFLHCAKALMRSDLWESRIQRSMLPSMGQMLKDQIEGLEQVETQSEMLQRYRQALY